MKAKLIFNLPEEREDFETASRAWDYRNTIEEFDHKLRVMQKYEDIETIEITKVRDLLREVLDDNNLKIE